MPKSGCGIILWDYGPTSAARPPPRAPGRGHPGAGHRGPGDDGMPGPGPRTDAATATGAGPDIQFDIAALLAAPPQTFGTGVDFQMPPVHTVFVTAAPGARPRPRPTRPAGQRAGPAGGGLPVRRGEPAHVRVLRAAVLQAAARRADGQPRVRATCPGCSPTTAGTCWKRRCRARPTSARPTRASPSCGSTCRVDRGQRHAVHAAQRQRGVPLRRAGLVRRQQQAARAARSPPRPGAGCSASRPAGTCSSRWGCRRRSPRRTACPSPITSSTESPMWMGFADQQVNGVRPAADLHVRGQLLGAR